MAFAAADASRGAFATIALPRPFRSSPPFAAMAGNDDVRLFSAVVIIPGSFAASSGTFVLMPSVSALMNSVPFSPIIGRAVLSAVLMAVGIFLSTFQMAGMRLPRYVTDDSTRACIAGPTSCPKARLPMRFLAAADIDAKDPDSVVAASFAVVPVIPRLSWITCMAE